MRLYFHSLQTFLSGQYWCQLQGNIGNGLFNQFKDLDGGRKASSNVIITWIVGSTQKPV